MQSIVFFPRSPTKAIFFHLGQNIWSQIQACGLATQYGEDTDTAAVAFLPVDKILDAVTLLNEQMQPNASGVVKYIEKKYVLGRLSEHTWSQVCAPPMFPPKCGLYMTVRTMGFYEPKTDMKEGIGEGGGTFSWSTRNTGSTR